MGNMRNAKPWIQCSFRFGPVQYDSDPMMLLWSNVLGACSQPKYVEALNLVWTPIFIDKELGEHVSNSAMRMRLGTGAKCL